MVWLPPPSQFGVVRESDHLQEVFFFFFFSLPFMFIYFLIIEDTCCIIFVVDMTF